MIELPVVRLREGARLPARAYPGDAGLDLTACERIELRPGERAVVPTGIAVANSPGLIDSGYRGEIRVVLLNTDSSETFVAEPGERIAQLVVLRVPAVEPVEVAELPASERGSRGFGSSRVA